MYYNGYNVCTIISYQDTHVDKDIFNIISLDNIIFKLNVESRKRVLENAIELFQSNTGISTFDLLYLFHEREQMGSTRLKTRSAIPHAFIAHTGAKVKTNPKNAHGADINMNDVFIILVVLEKTVDWEGADCSDHPVDVVAVCFSRSKRVCLNYVTILNSFMSDSKIIEQIKNADSKQSVYNIITNELKG